MMKKIAAFCLGVALAWLAGPAHAANFPLFSPATGVLKGNASTYVTTAATSSDIYGLWSGTCNSSSYLRGDGACVNPFSGVITFPDQSAPASPSAGNTKVYSSVTTASTISALTTKDSFGGVIQLGYEGHMVVYNATGGLITAGNVVYINGNQGNAPTIALAKADSASTLPAIGYTQYNISNGGYGEIHVFGPVTGNTLGFSSGDKLYVSDSVAGSITNAAPTSSTSYKQQIGTVLVGGSYGTGQFQLWANQPLPVILPPSGGGTNNGFTSFTGPATSTKTFTLPNASATVLTDNAAVTAAQGGTGQTTYTTGDMLYASSSSALSKLADVAAGSFLRSGGTSTAPAWSVVTVPNAAVLGDLWYGSAASTVSALAGNTTSTKNFLVQTGTGTVSAAPSWGTIASGDVPALGGNPSVTIGLSATNGVATTYLRSDGAPALSESIVPTWTGVHTFQGDAVSPSTSVSGVLPGAHSGAALMYWVNTNGASNAKFWEDITAATTMTRRLVNDALNTVSNVWVTTRSGVTQTDNSFGNATDNPTFQILGTGAVTAGGSIKSLNATGGIGYGAGAGGTVTQLTSRTTGVTCNKVTCQITLFTAAGSTTPATFTVSDSAVAATDTVVVNEASGTNLYEIFVTAVGSTTFNITFFTTGGTASDTPVFNFNVIKGSAN